MSSRHLATGGVARFNYVLVTNSNPVKTCASDGQVNPHPYKEGYLEVGFCPPNSLLSTAALSLYK
jgi:hypothetical protein